MCGRKNKERDVAWSQHQIALFLKVYIYGDGHGIKRRRGKKYSRRGERRGKEEEGRKSGRSRAGEEGRGRGEGS